MSGLPKAVALLLACALSLAACGGEKEKAATRPAAKDTPEPAQAEGCQKVAKPEVRPEVRLPKPSLKLDPAKTYVAHVVTSCGQFDITLDAKRAPVTGGSFASLVSKRFYDGLTIHRVVSGFVIQGGDPKGNGTGGPGYSVTEAPPQNLVYSRGVVAMAKAQTEASGTSGSQFFVVTGEAPQLGPDYALLGKVTTGMDVVDKIGVAAVGANDAPTQPIVIRSIRITTS